MNGGRKHLIVPSAWGAILLAMIAPPTAAGQRGGAIGGGGGGDDYTSIGRGAAGLDRSVPAQEPPSSAIDNPATKAKLDHDQNIKDAVLLAQLADEVKQELENGGESTLSVASLKKSEAMGQTRQEVARPHEDRQRIGPQSSLWGRDESVRSEAVSCRGSGLCRHPRRESARTIL
jgi:hypothetical protein